MVLSISIFSVTGARPIIHWQWCVLIISHIFHFIYHLFKQKKSLFFYRPVKWCNMLV